MFLLIHTFTTFNFETIQFKIKHIQISPENILLCEYRINVFFIIPVAFMYSFRV